MSNERFGEAWRQHLRTSILRVLSDAPAYSANESLLTDALRALGFGATRDQVRGELVWLAEQGLIHTENLGGLIIATATERGCDVAKGLATHPGVKKPSPRA